jgi:hypothetical protein
MKTGWKRDFSCRQPLLVLIILYFFLEVIANDTDSKSNNPEITGFVQGWYEYLEIPGNGNENTFSIHRARVGVMDSIIKKDTTYWFYYKVTLGAVEPPDSNTHLVDAYADFNLNPYCKIKFGQFQVPFGLEGPESIKDNPMIERALTIRLLNPFRMFRDIGLECNGSYKKIDYSVAIVTNFSIGGSFHLGKSGDGDPGRLVNLKRFGVDLTYSYKGLVLRSEGQYRYYNNAVSEYTDDGGWYLVAGYRFPVKIEPSKKDTTYIIEPLVRYQQYFPGISGSDSWNDEVTVGLNYYLHKKIRFSLNYAYRRFDLWGDGNVLVIQIQYSI